MAIALVTLLAFLAGSAFKSRRSSALDVPANALPQAGLDNRGTSGGPPEGAVRAPDISQLSPEESAGRLYKRVMLLYGEGKTDSVLFFAPMALQSYQMLGPLDMGQRYEMGQIAEVAGAFPLALAQADTILKANPNHLLGLLLAARVATDEKRTIDRTSYETRLVAAYPREIAKKLPEYQHHAADIRSAIDAAHAPASKPE